MPSASSDAVKLSEIKPCIPVHVLRTRLLEWSQGTVIEVPPTADTLHATCEQKRMALPLRCRYHGYVDNVFVKGEGKSISTSLLPSCSFAVVLQLIRTVMAASFFKNARDIRIGGRAQFIAGHSGMPNKVTRDDSSGRAGVCSSLMSMSSSEYKHSKDSTTGSSEGEEDLEDTKDNRRKRRAQSMRLMHRVR